MSDPASLGCQRLGVVPLPPLDEDKLGIALETLRDLPLNGVRHQPEGGTCGWYIWGGAIDPSNQGDAFFQPLHVRHVAQHCPEAVPYLSLPPGWRFLVAPGYEDVWEDQSVVPR